jgi:mRNA interferase MazF
MARRYVPERGDVIWCDFDPTLGHEQAHQRPALVLSPALFNDKVGLALVVPITSTVRGHGLEVEISGRKVQGVALIQQQRTIDYRAGRVKFVERAGADVIKGALLRARAILAD